MKLFIMAIEPVETRYTKQWYDLLGKQIFDHAKQFPTKDVEIIQVPGLFAEEVSKPSPGAFLNFEATNTWKASQFVALASYWEHMRDGDVVLFTDAWNAQAIQLRYMIELSGKKVKMFGMWHAGSYDPWDFLGRIASKSWSYSFEVALANAYDCNLFATDFSWRLFNTMLPFTPATDSYKFEIVGWPMEYLKDWCYSKPKKRQVVFPHRLSVEKNVDKARELEDMLKPKGIEFVFCQEKELTKDEYHEVLAESMIVLSLSKQETLGIGMYEGVLSGCLPLAPNHLSYKEILYGSPFLFDPYDIDYNLPFLADMLEGMIDNYDELHASTKDALLSAYEGYFTGTKLYNLLLT